MNIYTRTFFILGLVGWVAFAGSVAMNRDSAGMDPSTGFVNMMLMGIFGLVGAIAYKVLDRK